MAPEDRIELPIGDAVAEWIDELGDAPDGFADEAVDAWQAELASVPRLDEARAERTSPTRVAIVAGLAAAAAILLALAWPRPAGEVERGVALAECGEMVQPNLPPPRPPTISVLDPTPVLADPECHVGAATTGEVGLAGVRLAARDVLADRCAPCHLGSDDEAQPAALKVFDVEAERWWTSIATGQLDAMNDRMSAHPAADRAKVGAFVDAERAHRG